MKKILFFVVMVWFVNFSYPAFAYTECETGISRIWTGQDGFIYLVFSNGGSAYISPGDPDREAILATMTTALVAQRPITVRYDADGVTCTAANRMDVQGIWLH
ncbi:hypothetical protein BA950_07715 [Erythrobacter sp. SAORIC-644]|uniref:hypothetical protein n=1 Tax=Erythrobacter sp. SAORIC-644 TaxID=1869314 RepID=UPI000C9ED67B|nr:hypothetical protein [Erythrobacter sp. SAORIC-644]PNQ76355.1 hypothetical protein BA950_07715 [Erythrobacter sp. SAORIC-644]